MPPVPVSFNDLAVIAPMLIVIVTAMVVLMVDLALPRDRKSACVAVSIVGLVLAWVACFPAVAVRHLHPAADGIQWLRRRRWLCAGLSDYPDSCRRAVHSAV